MAHRYPAFMPIPRACGELGEVSKNHIYDLVNSGHLVKVNSGRRSFITGDSLEAYVLKLTQAALAETAGDELINEGELALT